MGNLIEDGSKYEKNQSWERKFYRPHTFVRERMAEQRELPVIIELS